MKENDVLDQKPTNQAIDVSEATQQIETILDRVWRKEARVVVEKNGVPIAAIVTSDDFEQLHRLDRQTAERFAILEAMRAPFKDVPPEEIEREAAKALAEVRAEMRAERERAATDAS